MANDVLTATRSPLVEIASGNRAVTAGENLARRGDVVMVSVIGARPSRSYAAGTQALRYRAMNWVLPK